MTAPARSSDPSPAGATAQDLEALIDALLWVRHVLRILRRQTSEPYLRSNLRAAIAALTPANPRLRRILSKRRPAPGAPS